MSEHKFETLEQEYAFWIMTKAVISGESVVWDTGILQDILADFKKRLTQ